MNVKFEIKSLTWWFYEIMKMKLLLSNIYRNKWIICLFSILKCIWLRHFSCLIDWEKINSCLNYCIIWIKRSGHYLSFYNYNYFVTININKKIRIINIDHLIAGCLTWAASDQSARSGSTVSRASRQSSSSSPCPSTISRSQKTRKW